MIGIDTASIARIKKAVQNSSFSERVFTQSERDYCNGKPQPQQSYAGIFCAKEAAVKAIGQGFGNGVMPQDIEVLHRADGAPYLKFHGAAIALFAGYSAHLSISHDGDYAIAAVMLEKQ